MPKHIHPHSDQAIEARAIMESLKEYLVGFGLQTAIVNPNAGDTPWHYNAFLRIRDYGKIAWHEELNARPRETHLFLSLNDNGWVAVIRCSRCVNIPLSDPDSFSKIVAIARRS